MMRRATFDQLCTCSHETDTHGCVRAQQKEPAKEACRWCQGGRHVLHEKDKRFTEAEALAAFTSRSGAPMY